MLKPRSLLRLWSTAPRCGQVCLNSRTFASGASKENTIGFIGLGNMGAHMANNLLKTGRSLVVFDLVPTVLEKAEQQGAAIAASPQQVAEQASTVITMLPSSPHVKEVYLGDNGVLKTAQKNTLFIDSSTIDPNVAIEVASAVSTSGCRIVDAPVSGGVTGAEAATLTFMVGGDQNDFSEAKELLDHMGKNVVHCGPAGTGQTAKVCNNLILAISMIGVAEGMDLGVRLGIDPHKLAAIVNTSSGQCWSSQAYNPCPGIVPTVPASNNYAGGFGVDLMKKDLGLAMDAGKAVKALNIMGTVAHNVYEDLSKEGHGKKDFAYIYQFLKDNSK